jgi:hypothetical protein
VMLDLGTREIILPRTPGGQMKQQQQQQQWQA